MKNKKFRLGTYTAVTTVIVIVIAVVLNMLVNALPTKFTQFDMSSDDLYTIGEQTKKIVEGLDEEVTIYWIVQDGYEDKAVEKLLINYEELNKNIKIEKIDPVVNPNFAYQYTSDDIYNNSLVVANADQSRTRYIGYYEIYTITYDQNYTEQSSFGGEAELTSAINYVSSDRFTFVYYLTGHGETALPTEFVETLKKENITVMELNLLSEGKVPEECEALIIHSPETDLSSRDSEMIAQYLEEGGSMLLLTDCSDNNMPNLNGVMSEYGVSAVDGMLIEGDGNYCLGGYANYLLPQMGAHEITDPLISKGYHIIAPMAQGIDVSDTLDENTTVTKLLNTSNLAYSKLSGVNTDSIEKEEGDIESEDGFAIGVAVERTTDSAETRIVWLSSYHLINAQIDSMSAGANGDLAVNSIGWMCDLEESISIRAKDIEYEYLNLTAAETGRWTLIMVAIIPLLFVIAGVTVWLRRRKL
ncbi:MAG: GldG family protein [Firmicutes bacterium]|nr:GldG family protein [Bacillota bacterium]